MAERSPHPVLRLGFAIAVILLSLAAIEMAMRYINWPRDVTSGWRTTVPGKPTNQLGFRGQPWAPFRPSDFVVVMTGGADVECRACPPDETLDVMLERALRPFIPDVRVVTLGAAGYAQDQEYLALHAYLLHRHADLVIDWATIADDVPGNTFRYGQPQPGIWRPKPTFALRGDESVGPTEWLGQSIYRSKLTRLIRPWFIDLDRNWTTLLPAADPGGDSAPPDIALRRSVADPLEQQRTAWSIWLTPRPPRVKYGIALTHALLRRMDQLAMLHGARLLVLLTPEAAGDSAPSPIALEHGGHWFVADPAARDAAIAEATRGFDTIALPWANPRPPTPDAERDLMARLAATLNQRALLVQVAEDHPRH